jgi:hypothetical protein
MVEGREGGREGGRAIPGQKPLHEGREHLQVLLVPRGDHVDGGPTHVVLGLYRPVLLGVGARTLAPPATFLGGWPRVGGGRGGGREGGREGGRGMDEGREGGVRTRGGREGRETKG